MFKLEHDFPLVYTKHGLQRFVLRGLVCEPLRLAQTAQGGEWSCDSEHLCTLAGMASPSWSPEGLIQRPAQRRHPHGFYQAGRYWLSLAPLFHQAARVPEKLSDVSRSTQPEWSACSGILRVLAQFIIQGSTLIFIVGNDIKLFPQSRHH